LQQKLGSSVVDRAQQFIHRISVVPEALTAMATGAVRAMHDPTEGGISNGLHELADASGLGFIVDRSKIVIQEETQKICQVFNINPLDLIASGAMLMAVEEKQAPQILEALQKAKITAAVIGRLVADTSQRTIIDFDGSIKPLRQPTEDALWKALQKLV
jgi:hydrogenase maturation factor